MEPLNTIDWAQMPAMALLVIGIIALAFYTYKSTQVSATTQAAAIRAGTEAVGKALEAMKATQVESREFYLGKLEDMRSRMRLLEDRVRELEEQVEEKNQRIEPRTEAQPEPVLPRNGVEELERENRQLHAEMDDLRRELAETRPARRKADET